MKEWFMMNDLHGDSRSGRNVTEAVICRITPWISFLTSFSSFFLGTLKPHNVEVKIHKTL